MRRLHDDVEDERAGAESQLGLLAIQVQNGLFHRSDRPRADPTPPMEHPVDGRPRQLRLRGDVVDALLPRHAASVGAAGRMRRF